MKKQIITGFLFRGLVGCGFGPLVLAVSYLVLQFQGAVETLTVGQVCTGIFSLSALAFVVGGMNVVYQIERLPLMTAIFLHGSVLYICYLMTYLLNGWLERGVRPVLVFTGAFVLGYLVIWAMIYFTVKKRADRVNAILKKKQGAA